MTVDNGVLGILFSTWMLLMTMSLVGNVVTGFPSTGSVDFWRLWALCKSYRLLAFICKSLWGGGRWQELTYLYSLQLRKLLISCIIHQKRPVFWNTPFVLKLCSLKGSFFSDTVTTAAEQGQRILSVASLISVVMTPDTGFPYIKVAWRKL